MNRLRKAERKFSLLKQGELTDLPSIQEFLKGIGAKEPQGIVKLVTMSGVMFNKENTLTAWIMAYDASGKILGNLDTKEASETFRDNSDRNRNRVAFWFNSMCYYFNIYVLVLGMM
jgi:hypothetical protein